MNISEALNHLMEGKKIKHKDSEDIFWLYKNEIAVYKKLYSDCGYSIEFCDCLSVKPEEFNDWRIVTEPLNIDLSDCELTSALQLIRKGYTLKRPKTGKRYNNTDLSKNTFTIEDMEANDWVVED